MRGEILQSIRHRIMYFVAENIASILEITSQNTWVSIKPNVAVDVGFYLSVPQQWYSYSNVEVMCPVFWGSYHTINPSNYNGIPL